MLNFILYQYLEHALSKRKYSKTCVKWPLLKRPKICFQDQVSLNAGQKYCRMLPLEHSAILLTFIKLPFVIKTFVLSIYEWPFYTGFTVSYNQTSQKYSEQISTKHGLEAFWWRSYCCVFFVVVALLVFVCVEGAGVFSPGFVINM